MTSRRGFATCCFGSRGCSLLTRVIPKASSFCRPRARHAIYRSPLPCLAYRAGDLPGGAGPVTGGLASNIMRASDRGNASAGFITAPKSRAVRHGLSLRPAPNACRNSLLQKAARASHPLCGIDRERRPSSGRTAAYRAKLYRWPRNKPLCLQPRAPPARITN